MSEQLSQALQNFVVMLVTGILGVLCAFLIALAKKGFNWIDEKISSIKSQRARDDLQEAMEVLETVVENTVTSLQQTLGDEIRESINNCDGKYTREDLLALKDKAVEMVKAQLNSSTIEILNGTYDSIKDLIESMIESQVYYLKLNEPAEITEFNPSYSFDDPYETATTSDYFINNEECNDDSGEEDCEECKIEF